MLRTYYVYVSIYITTVQAFAKVLNAIYIRFVLVVYCFRGFEIDTHWVYVRFTSFERYKIDFISF